MASGDTTTEALLNILGNGGDPTPYVGCGNTKTQNYILDAIGRMNGIEQEIEDLKNNPDVVDIVDTYADLQAYDTSGLTDKDIIRVLEDSTHNNKSTYYRWTASSSSWVYVGEAGGSVDIVQSTGSSTTSVMSQNAVTTELGNKVNKGTTLSLAIDPASWSDELSIDPYTKSIEIAWIMPLTNDSVVELINDDPVNFAKYGFAIQSVNTSTNMIKVISIGVPDTFVSLTINAR